MHREALIQVKESRGISNADISRVSGISQNHLSQFFRGNRNATDQILDQILLAMDKISQGAKQDYGAIIAGGLQKHNYDEMTEEIIADEIFRLSSAWKRMQKKNKEIRQKNKELDQEDGKQIVGSGAQ